MADDTYILVVRFSAMGDVALTAPVAGAAETGTGKILFLTRSAFADFFINMDGVEVFKADLGGRHKGLTGIIRLFSDINRAYRIKCVIDLHSVLRSWIIGLLYRLKGIKVYSIDKGRRDKKNFIKYKKEINLPHTTDRYRNVFRKAGFNIRSARIPSFNISNKAKEEAAEIIRHNVPAGYTIVGISPFAKHRTKSWGIENVRELMQTIRSEYDVYFLLFGSREEVAGLISLASSGKCYIVAGKHKLETELAIISRLEFMISMDSANMHLAALSGIRTVSIWGGTHPLTGWAPSGDQQHLVIGISMNDLDCRPCTIYGKGECLRKDVKYKCLKDIKPEMVYTRMKQSGILA
ncbi:MAG: glycosyltransferase family 9 protein [Bacteroidota bacterium]|nr:glycosyltransferase family 9 protein [Bacteroidota bacterium]